VPKKQLKLSILMFVWASYYISPIFFLAKNVGLEKVISEIECSTLVAKAIVSLILLSVSYIIFGTAALYYKSTSVSFIFLKYGPLIGAILVTLDVLKTQYVNINYHVFGVGLIIQSIIYVLMPWVLAIVSFCLVKRENQIAT
jgi:hypothetical protein